jgi:hypothetical protein
MLKESLERLWDYSYEGTMTNYLGTWMNQLRPDMISDRDAARLQLAGTPILFSKDSLAFRR